MLLSTERLKGFFLILEVTAKHLNFLRANIFGLCVGLCRLQMFMLLCVGFSFYAVALVYSL